MTTLTRKQLFDLIWSKPMRDAATDIGVSDVGLKKVCVRHRVPVPPRGYWNRVHAGQKPAKAIFREISDPALNRVEIYGAQYSPSPEVKKALSEAKAREQAPDRNIAIPPLAAPTLPAAIQLAVALKKSKTDDGALTHVADPKLFSVQVAATNIDRAVSIVEALLTAAAERGFSTAPGAKHLAMVVDGEAIVLLLKETIKRGPHVRTQEEIDREEQREKANRRGNWSLYARLYQSEPRWDYRATGQLVLEVEGKEYLNVRSRWSDTTTRKLEIMLNDVLAGLSAYAAARKQRKAEHEQRQREWALAEQHKAEARARAQLDKARVAFLEERLAAFDEMRRLDRFLARLAEESHWQNPPPRLSEFLQWAERRGQHLKRRCSAGALQEDLADSPLFGPNPRPRSAWSWP